MNRSIRVFSPIGNPPDLGEETKTDVPELARGLIGVLDNTKPNARLMRGEVARTVSERVGDIRLEFERKNSAAEGMTEDVRKRLAAAANVIFTGAGD